MDKKKDEQIRGLKTEAIQHILDHQQSPEDKPQSAEHPLGGLVHITGIGQVTVEQLRVELARRHGD